MTLPAGHPGPVTAALPPDAVEAAMAAYEREGARLAALVPQVAAVQAALSGRRWVPGAGRWTPPDPGGPDHSAGSGRGVR